MINTYPPLLLTLRMTPRAHISVSNHRGQTVVVKYGGHAMENAELKKKFASDIALLKQVSRTVLGG